MAQLETMLTQRNEAQAAFEEAVRRLRDAERELNDVRDRRARAKRNSDFDSYLDLAEVEKRAFQKFELLTHEEKRLGMQFAEIDKRHEDTRLAALGLYSDLRRHDLTAIPAREQRIRELEAQIELERAGIENAQRRRQHVVEKLALLTDLSEAELKEPNPQNPAIGRYNRRGVIFARM